MATLQAIWPFVAALLPTIGLVYLFWVIMKHILEADRRERAAQREWEQSLKRAEPGPTVPPQSDTSG